MSLYFNMPLELHRIAAIRFKDKASTIPLSSVDKLLYGYLNGLGVIHGYDSIFPNVDQVSRHLAISERTLYRALTKLEKVKLIKRTRVKQEGKFDSNKYKVIQPNRVNRVLWLDATGSELVGSYYNFNPDIYKKRTR